MKGHSTSTGQSAEAFCEVAVLVQRWKDPRIRPDVYAVGQEEWKRLHWEIQCVYDYPVRDFEICGVKVIALEVIACPRPTRSTRPKWWQCSI